MIEKGLAIAVTENNNRMKIKSYTRKEYLDYCDKNGVKTRLSENKRNPYTISGYPIIRPLGKIVDSCDADEWYYNHW